MMPTCKICQCSSNNLTCMDLRKVSDHLFQWFLLLQHRLLKKQTDEIDVMISSSTRARKWFEEQIRLRPAEQLIATLNQVKRSRCKESHEMTMIFVLFCHIEKCILE